MVSCCGCCSNSISSRRCCWMRTCSSFELHERVRGWCSVNIVGFEKCLKFVGRKSKTKENDEELKSSYKGGAYTIDSDIKLFALQVHGKAIIAHFHSLFWTWIYNDRNNIIKIFSWEVCMVEFPYNFSFTRNGKRTSSQLKSLFFRFCWPPEKWARSHFLRETRAGSCSEVCWRENRGSWSMLFFPIEQKKLQKIYCAHSLSQENLSKKKLSKWEDCKFSELNSTNAMVEKCSKEKFSFCTISSS